MQTDNSMNMQNHVSLNGMDSRDRVSLMKKIQMYDFVVDETVLYLDTHPACQQALEHFRKYKAMLDEAMKEYHEKYGPLTAESSAGMDVWDWVKGPWPWEKEAN